MILLAISVLLESVKECKQKSDPSEFFHHVVVDLEKVLIGIYHSLPQETLIAAVVDPRFKSLSHVPIEEHEEAWCCLQAEFYSPTFFQKKNELEMDQAQTVTEFKEENIGEKRKLDDFLLEYQKKKAKNGKDVASKKRIRKISSSA